MSIRQSDFYLLPNLLSLSRVISIPIVIGLLYYEMNIGALITFLLVGVSDYVDGWVARRYQSESKLGILLDPLADKLLITSAFIMLIPPGRVPAWMVALIISREMAVTGLRAIATNAGVVISASALGKYKTVFQIVSLVGLILHYEFYGIDFHAVGVVLLYLAFALTIWSGIDYFVNFFRKYSLSDD